MYPNASDVLPLPPRPRVEQYKKLAKDLVKACKAAEEGAIARWAVRWIATVTSLSTDSIHNTDHIVDQLARFAGEKLQTSGPGERPCALSGAQFVVARAHGFASWPRFAKHLEALGEEDSGPSKFERAAEAVVAGDAATLRRLLRRDPALALARSAREHRATLLHYVGANGFENYRQKTPKNAVEIARILLDAGAEIDAVTGPAMGAGTALGLVATSVHPLVAGVQADLLDLLIERGASVDGGPGGWNPLIAALHNGRGAAASLLASRGARLDLEGASGSGCLDVVRTFFDRGGALLPSASPTAMQLGFLWACQYGHDDVVEYLLDRGADLTAAATTGLTGLHWAVVGRQLSTVELLLARGADLEQANAYGGTALGAATWCVVNHQAFDYGPVVEALLRSGADVRQADFPTGRADVDDLLRRYGAAAD